MIYVRKILTDVTVKHLLNFYEFCTFRDGGNTGPKDKKHKYNLEIDDVNHLSAMSKILMREVASCKCTKSFLLPKRYSPPMFLKYDENMHYDFHNDYYDQEGVKTHYSATVFLSDPSEYEGGELNIKVGDQNLVFKEPAGTAVVYPTGLWHTINKVTSGCRKVSVFWIESLIDDPAVRDCCASIGKMLYDSASLPDDDVNHISKENKLKLDNIIFNLIRSHGNIK